MDTTLAKTGRELTVAAGKTILDTLREAGIDVPHSCTEGACGACETKVLEGIPDHRDLILTEAERAMEEIMLSEKDNNILSSYRG